MGYFVPWALHGLLGIYDIYGDFDIFQPYLRFFPSFAK